MIMYDCVSVAQIVQNGDNGPNLFLRAIATRGRYESFFLEGPDSYLHFYMHAQEANLIQEHRRRVSKMYIKNRSVEFLSCSLIKSS